MIKRSLILASLLLFASCRQNDTAKALEFLYDNMSLADSLSYSEDFWRANVEKTLELRERMAWGVPDREFNHFVLPLRANNENLDSFRIIYSDSLCARVSGMTMYDAVLEINHWCHEMATYRPSDGRTSSPLATVSSGFGRCGEESVLGVAALRAAGIPARQVYTPRWAHTDDNHAWIEAWVDGKWYFLGACEPEPKLNMGWFNAPVSRALLLHTRAFGKYDGEEDVISRTSAYTEINVTGNYVPVRKSSVMVCDRDGEPVEGAEVEYKIYNYAEFYTVARYTTGQDGIVSLHTGLGNMLACAYKDGRFGIAKIEGELTEVALDHNFGDNFSVDFDIVPPAENPIPSSATDEELAECRSRFEKENTIRDAREKLTGKTVAAFLAANPSNEAAEAICKSLSFKDNNDVSRDVLDDALSHVDGEFKEYRDSPRIELEFLRPYFKELASGMSFASPAEILEWVRTEIKVDDLANPQRLRIPPVVVWRSRMSDSRSRNIFFVAMCRACGFQARIEGVTGKTQYFDDDKWVDVDFDKEEVPSSHPGYLSVKVSPLSSVSDPIYYRHFTLAKMVDSHASLLSFDEDEDETASRLFSKPYPLDPAWYCMTSGMRMADGSVLAHMEFFNVCSGCNVEVPLLVRNSTDKLSVIGSIDAEPYLPVTGRGYFLIAVLGDNDEPSIHAVNQLAAMSETLNKWGRSCLIYGKARQLGIENSIFYEKGGKEIRQSLCNGCKVEKRSLPIVAVCDSFGRVVYLSQGYNTSLGQDLSKVIDQL